MLSRVRTHLQWRFEDRLRRRGYRLERIGSGDRLHKRASDDFELHDVRLDLAEDWVTPQLREAIYDDWYEKPEADIIKATLQPDDRVLEIGCGIGFIATIASRIAESVRCYDANPAIVGSARRTIDRNGASVTVTAAVLQREPTAQTTDFYIHNDFWASSLVPNPQATKIAVPVLDFEWEITKHEASYLIVDIEGGETDLLPGPLPACVRKLCVECHPAVSQPAAITAMLVSLLSHGFALSLDNSRPPVLYFER